MQMYKVVFFLFPENRSEFFLRENWQSLKKVRDNVVVNALPAPLFYCCCCCHVVVHTYSHAKCIRKNGRRGEIKQLGRGGRRRTCFFNRRTDLPQTDMVDIFPPRMNCILYSNVSRKKGEKWCKFEKYTASVREKGHPVDLPFFPDASGFSEDIFVRSVAEKWSVTFTMRHPTYFFPRNRA